MAILNRLSAILLCCDSTPFFASRCGISGDSMLAILGIVRFAIRDSVPLRLLHCPRMVFAVVLWLQIMAACILAIVDTDHYVLDKTRRLLTLPFHEKEFPKHPLP